MMTDTTDEQEALLGDGEDTSEELDFEPEDELGTVGSAKAKLAKLKDELTQVKQERQEYLDGWQRAKADAINVRKEAQLDASRAVHNAKTTLIEDIIPVLDSFDMAAGSAAWESVDASWRTGIEHIRSQLLDVLTRNGVERYGAVGDTFDHALHEVVQEVDDVAGESGSIVRIVRYGYRAGDRIIRAAQVITHT